MKSRCQFLARPAPFFTSSDFPSPLFTLAVLLSLAFNCPPAELAAASSSKNVVSKDSQNLLSFKSSLSNPNILSSWQHNQDPCLFTGVSCNNSRVSSLDLSFLHLSTDFRSVATHLFTLELLGSLTLKSTNLSGPLQPFKLCSHTLSEIDLSLNSVRGNFADLGYFSVCSGLSSLNISSNSLVSPTKKSSSAVRFSIPVQRLDVSSNQLTGDIVLPWLLSGACAKLSHLSLKGNRIRGNVSFASCENLAYLDISSNNFTRSFPSVGDCANLEHLDLSSNQFFGVIRDESLGGCQKLSYLNISYNQFIGPIPTLPTSTLGFLYLSANEFQGKIPDYLADACSHLVEFDLSMNNLSGTIPAGFKYCSSVQLFDISNNYFSGELPYDVLLNMGSSSLKKLNLGFNHFWGRLPDTVSLFSELEYLDLSSNNISGKIPNGICSTGKTRLKGLNLQNNLLTGPVPADLSNCSELVSLDLSFNYLTGKIPLSFRLLSKLTDLIMWMNQLYGEIPPEFKYIQSLENLILDYNQLTGTIPSGLRNCSNLNWISLSNNQLSGVIPSWIGSLGSLAILQLSNNSFHGPIPDELGDCKSLLWLDLNTNLLNGTIPGRLAKQSGKLAVGLLVGKKYVYLRNDNNKQCHGSGNLLEFAGIQQNALDRIPTKPECNFTRIYMGNTQPTFQHNGTMIFLDLSYNKLEGGIPKELGDMYNLQILNLAHNNLSGPIPDELGGLKEVGVLYLSHNHLSGKIPSSLTELTLLTDIDLSNNNLSGMIPDSGQFETFRADRFYNNSGLYGYPLPTCSSQSAASFSDPLSESCVDTYSSLPPPSSTQDDKEEDLNWVIWMVTLFGYGSGVVVGIVGGQVIIDMHYEWFMETFGRRQRKRKVKETRRSRR